MKTLLAAVLLMVSAAQAADLVHLDFKDASTQPRWKARAHQLSDVRIADGFITAVAQGTDPFYTLPDFTPFTATPGQCIEFKARAKVSGRGELFWIPAAAKGPQQKSSIGYEMIGDGQWHTYTIQPFWQADKTIKGLRLDFPATGRDTAFDLAYVRIYDQAPTATLGHGLLAQPIATDDNYILALRATTQTAQAATIAYATDGANGVHTLRVPLKPDGRPHTYNIDLSNEGFWQGKALYLKVDADATQIEQVLLGDTFVGGPDLALASAGMVDALNRAGRPLHVLVSLQNLGGAEAKDAVLRVSRMPKGVTCATPARTIATVAATTSTTETFTFTAENAVHGEVEFTLSNGTETQTLSAPIEFLANLNLPKAAYVPEPKPLALKNTIQLGALYFPGWSKVEAWERIWKVAPERKPILGWYDEAKPEVVDWQIKWAVENGLSYFMVDWYWDRGYQHHDHWIKAFQQAKYRKHLKWAMMWANHNGEGSHSEADQRAVTTWWCEHYFNTPEYYTIDGRPVVMLWSPQNYDRDMGPGGCKKALAISQEIAKQHGFKGIYFIAMKWPEHDCSPVLVQKLKDDGFEMTSIYHYMYHGGKTQNVGRRFSFDLVADSNKAHWEAWHSAGVLPFLPNLSTGWDDRPWHGEKGMEIYGRTVQHFQRICKDALAFSAASGVTNLLVAPLNEWGEGSYAEPNTQYGFGMYEALRETFCVKPETGWPLNYTPADVGLGPYDLPRKEKPVFTGAWDFRKDLDSWKPMMGIASSEQTRAGWQLLTKTHDPAVQLNFPMIAAKNYTQFIARMKVSGGAGCQLFWAADQNGTSEKRSLSLPLIADGQFHDYVFDLAKNKYWRGRIGHFRFDMANAENVTVTIERIEMK